MSTIWSAQHDEVTGLYDGGEFDVNAPEDPYPAMVRIEIDAGTYLADDARAYALKLLAAAEVADAANEVVFGGRP